MFRTIAVDRLTAGLVGIAAVALAAAAVSSPFDGAGVDGGTTGGESATGYGEVTTLDVPAVILVLAVVVATAVAVLAALYLVGHFWEVLGTSVGILVATVVHFAVYGAILVVVYWVVGDAWTVEPQAPADSVSVTGGVEGVADGDPTITMLFAYVLPIVGWFVVFAIALFFARKRSASTGSSIDADEPAIAGDRAAGVADAAGRAAERIAASDPADVDNEIYRAWMEMTTLLDVERPAASTPREFAEAAVDVGLDRQHVDELTDLFEEVRYGGAETTAEREDRAVETLRRIEATDGADRDLHPGGER